MKTNDQPNTVGWTLERWREAYERGALQPEFLIAWSRTLDGSDPAWISLASPELVQSQVLELQARRETAGSLAELPLFGVPFAVKDNIDALGFATTAACPAYSYRPARDAAVVERLRALGAIVVGKTNLDQFATGLVGTRSPYGIAPSRFDANYIGGGSSSGSASVVAQGLVPFALGTDTAGSGRVPAAFQNVVGVKPTVGRVSTRGVVPACRTLDCVSVFSLTVDDGGLVARLLEGHDPSNAYSRRRPLPSIPAAASTRWAIPSELEFFGDELARTAFEASLEDLREIGVTLVPIDFTPFRALARLLYEGPWVAERLWVVRELLAREPSALNEVVRGIIEGGARFSGVEVFDFEYQRAELARVIDAALEAVEGLIVPTTPTTFRIDEVAASPVLTNSKLGTYTNFTNLADLSALAVPGRFRSDGLPAGITLLGRAWRDEMLLDLGRRFQDRLRLPLGATGQTYQTLPRTTARPGDQLIAVVGAHLSGMGLNGQLTSRGARWAETTCTAPRYRLFALSGTNPLKPGLLRGMTGSPIELELWSLPIEQWASFLSVVPAPLAIGSIELADGRWVKGFVCEPCGLEGAEEITSYGGYRAFMASRSSSP